MVRQSDEEVVTEQPKKIKKKRLIKQSNVLPAKKLRTDYPSLSPGTRGKTLTGLEQIMPLGSRLLAREQSTAPSVSPPSQESKGFVDFSTQASLQIRTTVGSSSTLSAPVDRRHAPIPSTKAKLAYGMLRGIWLFNVGAARQICLRSEVRSRAEHELELKEKLNAKYAARGKLLEKKDSEILKLKSQLVEKEVETAEVVRLRDLVSSLSGEKSALTAEVSTLKVTLTQKDHDFSLLDSLVTHLESALNDAQVACTKAGTKITSLASERDRLSSEVSSLRVGFKDFKEKMEIQQEEGGILSHLLDSFGRKEVAPDPWNTTCLKSFEYQGILGHALGQAVDFGMQEGLKAGHEHGVAGRSLSVVDAYNPEAARANYFDTMRALEDASFPLVDLLKSKKDARMDEVLDCFLLDGPLAGLPEAAYLQPCIEQLSIPIHH
ncbi:hypothetical protein Tco_0005550, partial [Tanacetum coccineum]